MSRFLEKSPLFAVSSGKLEDVLRWKMIARHHYEVHWTGGICRVLQVISNLWIYTALNGVQVRPLAGIP